MKDLTSRRSKMKRLVLKLQWLKQNTLEMFGAGKSKTAVEPMETVVLEKTIIKIGSLLALGFGEAGAEIIGQNMQGSETSALNAMIPGRKVEAIFGFCDIRNFTDATEVLQDQVMVFVNRIAGVVHSCINEFFGSPNKNIGDAFLLVWRLSGHNSHKQCRLADMAVISFVKIIAQINKSPLLAEYRSHPKLVKRLPNYRVRLGFGLHSGWAIEGAIGSEFKIDASYLSPNVNMAARLEGVTKQYGCLMLISDALVTLCSEQIAQECRLIDHVAMVGRKQPFKLFTLDLDDLALEVEYGGASTKGTTHMGKSAKFKERADRQRRRNERWSDDFSLYSLFENDRDICTMRAKFTTEFFCRFNMAYLNYEAGNWAVAKSMLEHTRFLLATEDGPSAALLRYIKQNATDEGQAKKDWLGYRTLNDK
jgi:class 3 adenylate cyclase